MCEGWLTTWLSKCGPPTRQSWQAVPRDCLLRNTSYKEKIVLYTLSISQSLFIYNNIALQYLVTSGPRVKTGGGPHK